MRRFSLFSLPILALVLPALATAPLPSVPQEGAQEDAKEAADPLFGAKLVINGQAIPPQSIKRQVCLSALAQNHIEAEKLKIYTSEELELQAKAGKSVEGFEVSDEDINEIFEKVEEQLKEEYPEGDVTLEQVLKKDDGGKRLVRTTEIFKRVFLPENPSDYSDTTITALKAQENGDQLIDQMKIAYDLRVANDLEGVSPGERVFQTMLLQQIVKYLGDTADIVDDEALLPRNVLLRVNGKDILIDTIWNQVKSRVTSMEVRAAKQWLTNMTLLEQALSEAGVWMTEEEGKQAYFDHAEPYKGSIFSIERLAVTVKHFPSVGAYKKYYRAYESFHRLMKEKMTDEVLEEYGKRRTRHLIGQVTVDADVILLSAYDHKANQWKENGWAEAEAKTKEVLRLLVVDGKPWDQVLQKHSEFYDLPIPKSQMGQEPPHWITDKGRFRNKQRNILMKNLDESDYWLFLNGDSITDYIFYEQEVDQIGEAMRGPKGWYIPLLHRRSDPPARLSTSEENMRTLIEQDYLNYHLRMYVADLVSKNDVRGIDEPRAQ